MSDSEFLCVRCARCRRTCCQTSEVYATPGDVRRIQEYTGRDDFTEFRAPADPRYSPQDQDSEWARCVFRDDGTRRVLQRRPEGDCTFLGPQGCTLPLEVRPLVCRIYPYNYDDAGILPDLSPGCPLHWLSPGQTLIAALDMNLVDADRWQRLLYAEIQEEPHAQRHSLAGAAALAPSSPAKPCTSA